MASDQARTTASQSTLPAWRRAARPVLFALAAAWTAGIAWLAWSHWPRLPLDSAADASTRAAYHAAMKSHLTSAVLTGATGLALLLGLASLLGRRRADPDVAKPPSGAADAAWSGPSRILLTRHAEKTGELDDIHLSKPGRRRAERLATYIPETFGKPDFIFAAARSRRSIRSMETMQPLAAALGKQVRFDVEDKDFPALVDALTSDPAYRGTLVVVCWHHGKIPDIAAQLGAPDGTYPSHWSEKTFDVILELDYSRGAPPVVKKVVEPF